MHQHAVDDARPLSARAPDQRQARQLAVALAQLRVIRHDAVPGFAAQHGPVGAQLRAH
ncbi:hypothetical protein [Janthinobacterium agaricidamnosum]|uniref:hypothetical protein n=1 Tax=Janthinobacterium agaricidamnosum TaxID=55508 RepID=UPI001F09E300|nr:hypothetical protein [Janthinobacterium agaricidamnosum]